MQKPAPCTVCTKSPPKDGCSHMECPARILPTAQAPQRVEFIANGCTRTAPHLFED